MPDRRRLILLGLAALGGCAALPGHEPPRVGVVGLEPLPGQGLELRFLLKLRVQNPNDAALDYDGVFVELDLRGRPFATGVSDARGSVARYGEAVISVPLSVSALDVARQVLGAVRADAGRSVDYVLRGRLAGPSFGGVRFESSGQLDAPSLLGP